MTNRVCLVVVLAVALSAVATGQNQWQWPEKLQNMKVLPADWSGARLRPVMFGFTRALGVRCSYCHKGEEGKPLTTYDFVSDENPNKDKAREMLRMLSSINDHLKKIKPSGDKRVNMWCTTCHRGRPRPMSLAEELGEWYRENGTEAAVAHYTDLKKRFYGRGAYDFGEGSLNTFGYELLRSDDVKGAIAIFSLNTEQFPESANVWDSLGEAYLKSGDKEMARKSYSKSLELNPSNMNAKKMLQQIEGGGGK